MKVCLYAVYMNMNRKDDKKYVEIQNFDILGNKTVKTLFFYSKCFITLLVI